MNPMLSFITQDNAPKRLAALRWACAAALLRDSIQLPPSRYFTATELDGTRTAPPTTVPGPSGETVLLAITAPVAGTLWALGAMPTLTGLIAACASWRLDAIKKARLPGLSSATGHLQQVVLLLALAPRVRSHSADAHADGQRYDSQAAEQLAMLQLCVGLVYAQSVIAKLRNSGLQWVLSGQTVRNSLVTLGTPLGQRVAASPTACRAATIGAFTLECLAIPAIVCGPRARQAFGLAALAFHLSTFATMRISFWHLASLDIPLFVMKG